MTEIQIPDPRPVDADLLTVKEIATLATGTDGGPVKQGVVEYWRLRQKQGVPVFLEPDDYFGDTPVWRLERLEAWFKTTDRPYDVKRWRAAREAGQFQRKTPPNAKAAS